MLTLLADLAEERPLLCLIDDVHWLDRASLDALTFAARRLAAERITMVFAGRDGAEPAINGIPDLRISGLARSDCEQLLAGLTPEVRDRVIEEAEGNPLALLHFAGILTPEQRAGHLAPLPCNRRSRPWRGGWSSRCAPPSGGCPSAPGCCSWSPPPTGPAACGSCWGPRRRSARGPRTWSRPSTPRSSTSPATGCASGTRSSRPPPTTRRRSPGVRPPTGRWPASSTARSTPTGGPGTCRRPPSNPTSRPPPSSPRPATGRRGAAATPRPPPRTSGRRSSPWTGNGAPDGWPPPRSRRWAPGSSPAPRPPPTGGAAWPPIRCCWRGWPACGPRSRPSRGSGSGRAPAHRRRRGHRTGRARRGRVAARHGGGRGLVRGRPRRAPAGRRPPGVARRRRGGAAGGGGRGRPRHGTRRRRRPRHRPPLLRTALPLDLHAGEASVAVTDARHPAAIAVTDAGRPAADLPLLRALPQDPSTRETAATATDVHLPTGEAAVGITDAGLPVREAAIAAADVGSAAGEADGPATGAGLSASGVLAAVEGREVPVVGGVRPVVSGGGSERVAGTFAVFGALMTGDDDAACELAAARVAACRSRGLVGALPHALQLLTQAQILSGRHTEAAASGAEAWQIARDTGQEGRLRHLHGILARLAAIRGEDDECRRLAHQAEGSARERNGSGWGGCALTLLDLVRARYDTAAERMAGILDGPLGHTVIVTFAIADYVEACARLDEPDRATAAFARFDAWAEASGRPWAAAVAHRCRALLAPRQRAEAHFEAALAPAPLAGRPFEQARTRLLYGEWLRRARRRADAGTQLRAALHAFTELGAEPWAERARTELAATGVHAAEPGPPAASAALSTLTSQELQVVRLAATGATNRQIGAQLFLSPRTVGFHLYKAYPKLGISSRAELAGLDLGPP
ncbi:LuxR C-terminal-related transcriptional regulator [Nonomuraea rubra]|uniref:helix-turn-helix transcriptional regulator n=1 Tax=Nonomuraea rubra TaxID=46180 RepID=UPI003612E721